MTALFLRDVEVHDVRVDVTIRGGRLASVERTGTSAAPTGVEAIDGNGGALIPGLHDHHLHLLALAAAARSVIAGPPRVRSPGDLRRVLAAADAALPPGRWLRAVGYHESVAGDLGRHDLDRLVPERPARVQHCSGAMWILNTVGLHRVGLWSGDVAGTERDGRGEPTGRVYGADHELGRRWDDGEIPDLATVGSQLASYGITGVTDATPTTDPAALSALGRAVARNDLPQRIVVTGGPGLDESVIDDRLEVGPVKLVVADHHAPDPDGLARQIAVVHDRGRAVAVHCVTRAGLAVLISAWDEAGARAGDRVEHGSVIPPELAVRLLDLGVTVVTQPGFVADRGDRYLVEVEKEDRRHLYPCGSLLAAGVGVGGSSDAPFGDPDPWHGIATAITRRTEAGQLLGGAEAISPRRALDLYLTPLEAPGGPPRQVAVDRPADLCLLNDGLDIALREPSATGVRMTVAGGRVVGPAAV